MIKEKEGIVVRNTTVEEIITCDICGAQVDHYIDILTGHRDWLNDSCDSIEHHEVCSWDCAVKFMEKWKEGCDAKNSRTAYIEFDQYDAAKENEKKSYEEYLKLKTYYENKALEF